MRGLNVRAGEPELTPLPSPPPSLRGPQREDTEELLVELQYAVFIHRDWLALSVQKQRHNACWDFDS